MGFLIPAIIAGAGAAIGGLANRNSQKSQQSNQFERDKWQYEQDRAAREAASEDANRRRLSSIDFVQAVAQSRGYNIPTTAFDALRAYQRVPVPAGQMPRPRSPGIGTSLLSGLGTATSLYGEYGLKSALGQDPPGSYSRSRSGGTGSVGTGTSSPMVDVGKGFQANPLESSGSIYDLGRKYRPASVSDILEIG